MKRKLEVAVGLLLLVVMVAWQAQSATLTPQVKSAQAAAAEEWVLGVALPFTGDLGEYGKGFKEGIDLAVEQTNAQLAAAGRQLTFKVVSQDTGGTSDGAAKAVQTIVQTSGAQVVVGP